MEDESDQYSNQASSSNTARNPRNAGRKLEATDPDDRRIARNRRAQRAFRERKLKLIEDLEKQVRTQAERITELEAEKLRLQQELLLAQTAYPTTLEPLSLSTQRAIDLNQRLFMQQLAQVLLVSSNSPNPLLHCNILSRYQIQHK
ncbi:hypothetical protein BCR33DRAFT_767516 [Rhizoclosmatium globosum]|uniref:BZIP domain-containing protein n=1 Tax=Rhizoclosmatium globosum TaxID=329046 RepID=A0A1Y2C430_9FUNG|nr:hypothetical protein BCR33DRAFT_767516 [Rhizoclosmatium globosum]|eukprot:ORY41706.1 hypothetical protein BCR33DRAFT_767516 [Rhizoclosmatium globosum]